MVDIQLGAGITTIGIRALVSKVTTTTTRFEMEKLNGNRFLLLKMRATSLLIQEGDKVMALRV